MFKFLFRGLKSKDVVPDTDRERFKRLVGELNDLIETLPSKPRVTFDPETGFILPEMPEQFADEALALPAPNQDKDKDKAETATESIEAVAKPAVTEGDAMADTVAPAAPADPESAAEPSTTQERVG